MAVSAALVEEPGIPLAEAGTEEANLDSILKQATLIKHQVVKKGSTNNSKVDNYCLTSV